MHLGIGQEAEALVEIAVEVKRRPVRAREVGIVRGTGCRVALPAEDGNRDAEVLVARVLREVAADEVARRRVEELPFGQVAGLRVEVEVAAPGRLGAQLAALRNVVGRHGPLSDELAGRKLRSESHHIDASGTRGVGGNPGGSDVVVQVVPNLEVVTVVATPRRQGVGGSPGGQESQGQGEGEGEAQDSHAGENESEVQDVVWNHLLLLRPEPRSGE